MLLGTEDPLAVQLTEAIVTGDLHGLEGLLRENLGLATARIGGMDKCCGRIVSRSLLHIATDWPGNFPRGAATVNALIDAGAEVDARFEGAHSETPLHWAASCDDVEVLDALLDAGADIEATGAVIAGGTPLADAVAFGQWKAARRLVERGAKSNLWQAAALGLMPVVQGYMEAAQPPDKEEITQAFWLACHGGQLPAAQYLLALGADRHWVGYDNLPPIGAARRSEASDVVAWLGGLDATGPPS